jgi:hypothetical protein
MMRGYFQSLSALLVMSWIGVAGAGAADTATLKGKFVYDGKPPVPMVLQCNVQINKDQATCCKIQHVDESLMVDKNGGVANIFVYVRTAGVKVPDDIAKAYKDQVVLDNKVCRFEPHAVGLVKGQELVIGNSDNIGHNSNIAAQGINPIVPAGKQVPVDAKMITVIPNEVSCNIHPWMKAWVLVRPNPFFAVSADDGTFEIKGLPAGQELEFQVWQEKAGFVTAVKIKDKATTWERGRFKQKLKAGDNDLGDVKVAERNFNK